MDKIQAKILEIIDENSDKIKEIGRHIFCNAEMGYKEFNTAKLFADEMKKLGLKTEENLAITGVKSYLKDSKEDITISLMGELDALPIANHPDTNKETGASHCCGHNAQMAGIMGAALALTNPEIKKALGGNIAFFAVPAEEFVDIEFKKGLMSEGKIAYGGGKSELIRIGALDDIDITVGHHTAPQVEIAVANNSTNGFVNKMVKFKGIKAHAAGEPHKGVDALAAYHVAVTALDAQRETFKDDDTVRIHGFLTNGGEAVNVIADEITAEYSVRAKNINGYVDASKKFDRAMKAGAFALGAGVEIETFPGYFPVIPCPETSALEEAIGIVCEKTGYKDFSNVMPKHITGSTDYGELSSIMPLLQFNTGGYTGMLHNENIRVENEDLAYVTTAKIFALTAYNLLKDGAKNAKNLKETFNPVLTKETFINHMENMSGTEKIEINQLPVLD